MSKRPEFSGTKTVILMNKADLTYLLKEIYHVYPTLKVQNRYKKLRMLTCEQNLIVPHFIPMDIHAKPFMSHIIHR
jgi:hypothetical protein